MLSLASCIPEKIFSHPHLAAEEALLPLKGVELKKPRKTFTFEEIDNMISRMFYDQIFSPCS